MLAGCGEKEAVLPYLLLMMQKVSPAALEIALGLLNKLKMELSYDSVLYLIHYLEQVMSAYQRDVGLSSVAHYCVTLPMVWRQFRCPSTDGLIL